MAYQVTRAYRDGQLVKLSLGLDLVDDYLDFLRCRCRPNTWINYAHDLKVFFTAVNKPVNAITTADVFHFMQLQRPSSDPSQGVCIRTLKRRLCAVSGLYGYLLTRDDTEIARNPVPAGLMLRGQVSDTRPRSAPLLRAPQGLPQIVPVAQIQKFLASLNCYRDKAMVLLMALGGLRRAEVLAVKLDDLNLVQRTVMVREGKGGRQRVCCVAPLFFQVLDHYLQEERLQTTETTLFVVLKGPRRGQPLSVSGLNTIFAHHRRLAGTPEVTCHRLRHTCFTMLREAGMSLEALQQQAGHQSLNTTRVYIHLTNQALRAEYLKVSEQIFPAGMQEAEHA
jgi:integrase/recombinase XerD